MGTFEWPLRIASMDGHTSREIEATVDTGAAYTTLPGSLLRELGITPNGQTQIFVGRWTPDLDGHWASLGHNRWQE